MGLFWRSSNSLALPACSEKLGSSSNELEEESLLQKVDGKRKYLSKIKSLRFALGLKSWLAINLALSTLNLGAFLSFVVGYPAFVPLWLARQPAQQTECLLPPCQPPSLST